MNNSNSKKELENKSLFESYFEKDNCGMGFVASLRNEKTNKVIRDGIKILAGLEHRGAEAYDPNTGDGAGLLFEMPHRFFVEVCDGLPELGDYGTGNFFLPTNKLDYEKVKALIEVIVKENGEEFLFWREVPVKDDEIGVEARKSLPKIEQPFIKRKSATKEEFERKLYIIRRKKTGSSRQRR